MPRYKSIFTLEAHREKRFHNSYLVVGDCWIWNKSKDRDGYGKGPANGVRSHRYSYARFVGEIPAEMCVCHRCDNPSCVNPEHLFLGTNAENTADRNRKNRQAKMDKIRPDSVSRELAIRIRDELLSGEKHASVAMKYGISSAQSSMIKRGLTWHFRP